MEEDFNEKPMDDNMVDDPSLMAYSPSRDLCAYASSGYPSSMPSSPLAWILSVGIDDGNATSSALSLVHSPSRLLGWPCEKTFREIEMDGDFNQKSMCDNMDLDAFLIDYPPSPMVPSPEASMIPPSPEPGFSQSIFSDGNGISCHLSKQTVRHSILNPVHNIPPRRRRRRCRRNYFLTEMMELSGATAKFFSVAMAESLTMAESRRATDLLLELYGATVELLRATTAELHFCAMEELLFCVMAKSRESLHFFLIEILQPKKAPCVLAKSFHHVFSHEILQQKKPHILSIITNLTVIDVSYTTVPIKLLTEKSLVQLRKLIFFSEGTDRKLMFLKLRNCISLWVYDCHVKGNVALPGFAPSTNSIVTRTEDVIHNVVSHPENEGIRKTSKRKITLKDLQRFSGSLKDAAKSFGVSVSTIKRCCRDHGLMDWRNRMVDNNNQYLSKPKDVIEFVKGEGAEMGNQIAGGSRPCEWELNHEQTGFPLLFEKGSDISQIAAGLIKESSTQLEITHAGDNFVSSTDDQCIVQLTELILSAACLRPVAFKFTLLQTAERKLLIDHYYAATEAFNAVVGVYLLELFVPPTITDNQEQEALFSSLWPTMKQHFRNLLEKKNIYVKIIIASADDQPDSRCKYNHISQSTTSSLGSNGLPDGEEVLQQDSLRHQLVGETQSINVGQNVLSEGGIYNAVSNPENEGARKTPKRKCRNIKRKITLEDLQHFSGSHMDAAKRFEVSESTIKRLCRQHGIWKYRKIDKNNQSLSEPKDTIESVQGEEAEMGTQMAGGSRSCERELNHEQIDFLAESEKGPDRSQIGTMTMKATYREDLTIRFQLSLTSGIIELRKVVAEKLMLEVGTFSIKYLDDDEDWILMTGDTDLQECFNISVSLSRKFIKLSISDKPAS